jgi:hypothetical protein
MKLTRVLIIGTVVFLFLASAAWAMSSANYRMDWFLALTGAGGGRAASSGYQVNLTTAQFIAGPAASANYKTQLGYWAGVLAEYRVYLPLVLRG